MLSVAVLIPAFRPHLLQEALQSLKKQTHAPDEVLVKSDSRPQAVRLNEAVQESRSDTFVILCDDDKLHPRFLESTLSALGENDIAYTDMLHFGAENWVQAAWEWTAENLAQHCTIFVSSLCRKSMWEKVGGFEDHVFGDWDFWWKCYHAGAQAVHIHEPLFLYRRHGDQRSNRVDHGQAHREILEKHARELASGTFK